MTPIDREAGAPLLWSGQVSPHECDEMGHLNISGYILKFLEAHNALCLDLGMRPPMHRGTVSRLLPVEYHVRYLAEARSGAPLEVRGGVTDHRSDTIESAYVMAHADGRPAATLRLSSALVARPSKRAFALVPALKDSATASQIALPDVARPRSFALDTIEPLASLPEHSLLGRGVFRKDEADSDGIVPLDRLTARLSNLVSRLFVPVYDAQPEGQTVTRLGAAQLEARMVTFGQPGVGQGFSLYAAFTALAEKTVQVSAWYADTRTGSVFAAIQAIVVFMDLDARKTVPISGELRRRVETACVPALALVGA